MIDKATAMLPKSGVIRIALGIGILAGVVWIAGPSLIGLMVNPPITFDTQRGNGTIHYVVSRSQVWPGDCVTFAWRVNGIQEVHFNDAGVVGEGHSDICVPLDGHQFPEIRLRVLFRDQITITYSPQVTFHDVANLAFPMALAIVGVAIFISPLPSQDVLRGLRIALVMTIPVGLGIVAALIGLWMLGNVFASPFMDEFVNRPWYSLLDTAHCGYYEITPYSSQPERLLFDQIEHLNNSEGQILIFGTSNAVESILPYQLSTYQHSHILNLAMGATTPLEYDALLQYLDEGKGMLHPQHGKTAIVLAFWSAVFAPNAWHYIYQNVFNLYQKFNLIENSNVDWMLKTTNDSLAPLMMAQARTAALFTHHLPVLVRRTLFPAVEQQRASNTASRCRPIHVSSTQLERTDFWRDYHGGDGYILPNLATIPLERMAQRATDANIPIIVIHLPLPSWLRNTSFQREYMTYMGDFAKRFHADVYDLSGLLQDNQFRDTAHPTIDGRSILTKAMLDIFIREALLPIES